MIRLKKTAIVFICAAVLLLGAFAAYEKLTFTVTVTTDGGGSVFCEKYVVHPFESTTLWILPDEGALKYELDTLLIDGEDVTDEVYKNKLKLNLILSDKTVVASFKVGNAPASSAAVFV